MPKFVNADTHAKIEHAKSVMREFLGTKQAELGRRVKEKFGTGLAPAYLSTIKKAAVAGKLDTLDYQVGSPADARRANKGGRKAAPKAAKSGAKRGPGRPKGSKNKPVPFADGERRKPGRREDDVRRARVTRSLTELPGFVVVVLRGGATDVEVFASRYSAENRIIQLLDSGVVLADIGYYHREEYVVDAIFRVSL
jgi:hypothetical protein